MKFSVLMSLYHKEKADNYKKCLQSLFDQTLKPHEIVVVHDGYIPSELLTVEENFKEILPLKIVPLEKNVGLGEALSVGLMHCSYEWIARMDTDDICFLDRFEKQMNYLQAHPDVDFLGAAVSEFSHDVSDIISYRVLPSDHESIVAFSKKRCPMNHMTVCYKKSVLKELGGYRTLLFLEDYYLWVRALQNNYQFANLKDSVVYMRAGKSMVGRRRGYNYLRNEFKLFNYMCKTSYITNYQFAKAMIVRVMVRLFPASILNVLYKKLLRQKKEG